MTERPATTHDENTREPSKSCNARSDISKAVEMIGVAQRLPGRAAYKVLVRLASESRMSVGGVASVIVRAHDVDSDRDGYSASA